MKNIHITITFFIFFSFSIIAQESPFGTGQINNQNIGILEDASVIESSPSGWGFNEFFPDAQQLLEDYNFDIYVPEDYDGTEPYGLVTFVNSGNNGGVKGNWIPVLEDEKLIWISGDEIGNPIWINIRMGVAAAATHRMKELFNIDEARIYTSGNSGGARMAHNLAFIYPDIYKGAMPSCGGSYIREVDQDYETQNPDGHYEAILDYPADYLDYVLPFDQRFANMTSFNDFREGDIMNIYHNGSELDGLKGKFLETSGGHCATTTEHFRDALNFVEHPFIEIINANFDGIDPIPFRKTNADITAFGAMQLGNGLSDFAQIQSQDLFKWNDPKGAIFKTEINLNPNDYNMNSIFHLGIWSMSEAENYCGFWGNQLYENLPAILLTIEFIDEQPTLFVKIENPEQPALNDTLFTSSFSDWEISEPLAIKYHLWNQELRIELSAHLEAPNATPTGVRLLDDMRSIRIRWNEVATNFWNENFWESGAFLTMTSEKIDLANSTSDIFVDNVELIVANVMIDVEIPMDSTFLESSICEGEQIEFNSEILTEAGVFETVLMNSSGCDSLVILDLTINELPIVTIEQINETLEATAGFSNYQWYQAGGLIEDENTASFSPAENGDYYVVVTDENGCTNSSNPINFMVNNIVELESLGITVFPNPVSNELFIQSDNPNFEAQILDINGRIIRDNLLAVNNLSDLANGIYLLKIKLNEEVAVVRLSKL